MILEAVNSVFLTFVVTEYLLIEDDTNKSEGQTPTNYQNNYCDEQSSGHHLTHILHRLKITFLSRHSKFTQCMFGVVGCINLFVRFHVSGAALSTWLHLKIEQLFHIPRIVIAIASFLTALYFDCRRKNASTINKTSNNISGTPNDNKGWSNAVFFRQLTQSFCILLPVYPFLAVIISFGFLFVVSLFEKLNLPLEILNMPIYYGTLYGPLSYLYWDVKKKMTARYYVNGGTRVFGDIVLPR